MGPRDKTAQTLPNFGGPQYNLKVVRVGATLCTQTRDEIEIHRRGGKFELDAEIVLYLHDVLIADCGDFENLSASNVHVERFKHQEVAQEEEAFVPTCRRISEIFQSSATTHTAKFPPGSPEQDEKALFSKKKTVNR